MSTPIAHAPTTNRWSLGRFGPWLAALVAIVLAASVALTMGTSQDAAVEPAVVLDDMTRSEVIDRVARINGFTTAVPQATATDGVAPDRSQTRGEVLERLYRIDGILPVAPDVPSHVR